MTFFLPSTYIGETHFPPRNLSPNASGDGMDGGTLTRRKANQVPAPPNSVSNSSSTVAGDSWRGGAGAGGQSSGQAPVPPAPPPSSAGQANFESFEGDVEDNESIFTDVLSPSGHADAQTLACMLQEQLDAINNEIRYLKKNMQQCFCDHSCIYVCVISDSSKRRR